MNYDLAPMEGITTYIYRSTFEKYYGGISQYYTPFLASMHLSNREKNEVLPEHNEGMTLIPQILSNRADEFLEITKALQAYGYDTVNLNLGCPSGTVVSKHRGSGFLAVPQELDTFLAEIFDQCPLKISIKTRIGISEESEWEPILKIYEKYPIAELIIHTRLQKDFYKLPARPHTFAAARRLGIPLCYNGDITSRNAQQLVLEADPQIDRMMIGRGIIANPELLESLNGGTPARDKDRLQSFLSDICDRYLAEMSGGERNTLYKLKEIWVYLGASFQDAEKYVKRIKKANRLTEYEAAMRALFHNCELKCEK
ncbi:MAG: tRNA-dihydrouridine synthase family protein [Lachnospiraceae bacterium]|nr:tRNA-dihydrouridine synthase family protein [Lachnospiraceae bacterium]